MTTPLLDPRLDWELHYDERSMLPEHRISSLGLPTALRSRAWRTWRTLDQGEEGKCVGYAAATWVGTTPRAKPQQATNALGDLLYDAAQELDEIPGIKYVGSTTLGGAKALKKLGHIASYSWARTMDEFLAALAHKGPVLTGIDWHEDMYRPAYVPAMRRAVFRATGAKVGGHEIEWNAIDVPRKLVRAHNTWGPSWGVKGEAWMAWDQVEQLVFRKQGDACLLVRA